MNAMLACASGRSVSIETIGSSESCKASTRSGSVRTASTRSRCSMYVSTRAIHATQAVSIATRRAERGDASAVICENAAVKTPLARHPVNPAGLSRTQDKSHPYTRAAARRPTPPRASSAADSCTASPGRCGTRTRRSPSPGAAPTAGWSRSRASCTRRAPVSIPQRGERE